MMCVLGGCVSNPPLAQNNTQMVPQILLETGAKLGVSFSNPLFAKQEKCYDNPMYFYGDKNTGLRAICYGYQPGSKMTTLFWVRKEIGMNEFVERNAIATAKTMAPKPGTDIRETPILVFIKEENGISYFDVSIGKNFKNIQSVFFIQTPEADKLGLKVAVMVKAPTVESAREYILTLKQVLQ
jgi:hypothetical protein